MNDPAVLTLKEKKKAEQELINNKGCSTQLCHGSYAHSGPCCVNLICPKRDSDI